MFGTGSGCWATVAPVAVLHVFGLPVGAEPSLVVTVMSPILGEGRRACGAWTCGTAFCCRDGGHQ
jgi:hypothetical protein